MTQILERFRVQKEKQKAVEAHTRYLMTGMELKGEPPCVAPPDVVFQLANEFEERFKQIRRESYTTQMTAAEMRELDRYKAFYHANKLSYMIRENVEMQEPYENRLLRYDGNTREVERLNITKKGADINQDQATIDYLDDRKKRLIRQVKEMPLEKLTPVEMEDAILTMEKLGMVDIEPGQIYLETLAERQMYEDIQAAPENNQSELKSQKSTGKRFPKLEADKSMIDKSPAIQQPETKSILKTSKTGIGRELTKTGIRMQTTLIRDSDSHSVDKQPINQQVTIQKDFFPQVSKILHNQATENYQEEIDAFSVSFTDFDAEEAQSQQEEEPDQMQDFPDLTKGSREFNLS